MSEQQQKQKVYVNGVFVKTQKTNYGDIIKLSCRVEDLVTFLQQNSNNGWVDIDLLQKREADEKGRTHTAVLNSWKPNKEAVPETQTPQPSDLPF